VKKREWAWEIFLFSGTMKSSINGRGTGERRGKRCSVVTTVRIIVDLSTTIGRKSGEEKMEGKKFIVS